MLWLLLLAVCVLLQVIAQRLSKLGTFKKTGAPERQPAEVLIKRRKRGRNGDVGWEIVRARGHLDEVLEMRKGGSKLGGYRTHCRQGYPTLSWGMSPDSSAGACISAPSALPCLVQHALRLCLVRGWLRPQHMPVAWVQFTSYHEAIPTASTSTE